MTERKYRKPVNANGWMRKLQRWTFGTATPNFVGYCPFFWFTWLCLLLSPFALITKMVGFVFAFLISAIPDTIFIARPTDKILLDFSQDVKDFGLSEVRSWKSYEQVFRWIAITPDWENCVKAIIAKRTKRAEKEAIREPKRARFANRLSRYSGYIVKPILAVLAMGALYLLLPPAFKSLVWLAQIILGITWGDLLFLGKGAGGFALAVLVLYGVIYLLMRFIEGLRGCPKCPEKIGWTYKTGLALGNGVEFLLETVAALYTSECPLIEWDDHDEPIQRR